MSFFFKICIQFSLSISRSKADIFRIFIYILRPFLPCPKVTSPAHGKHSFSRWLYCLHSFKLFFQMSKDKKATFREWSNFGNVFVSFLVPMVGKNYEFTTRIIPLRCIIPQFKIIGHIVVKKLKSPITHQDKKKIDECLQTNNNYRNCSLT